MSANLQDCLKDSGLRLIDPDAVDALRRNLHDAQQRIVELEAQVKQLLTPQWFAYPSDSEQGCESYMEEIENADPDNGIWMVNVAQLRALPELHVIIDVNHERSDSVIELFSTENKAEAQAKLAEFKLAAVAAQPRQEGASHE